MDVLDVTVDYGQHEFPGFKVLLQGHLYPRGDVSFLYQGIRYLPHQDVYIVVADLPVHKRLEKPVFLPLAQQPGILKLDLPYQDAEPAFIRGSGPLALLCLFPLLLFNSLPFPQSLFYFLPLPLYFTDGLLAFRQGRFHNAGERE